MTIEEVVRDIMKDRVFNYTSNGKNKFEAKGLLKELLDKLWILRSTWLFGLSERNCGISPIYFGILYPWL